MELHDNPFSPYAFKVRATLYEKGIEFEKREVRRHADRERLLKLNPRGEVPALVDGDVVLADRERLLELNPRGEVPALVDGDVVLADSKVICAYLEDKFPDPPLLPKEPAKRARCRYLELKSDTEVDALVVALGTMKLFRPELQSEHPDALARVEKLIADYHAWLDRELDGRDWFLGELSLVDIALVPHLASANFMGCPVGKEHRSLARWVARASERPSIAQATREMAEGFANAQSDPDSLFDPKRLHWRNDRIEALVRCGLGQWLVDEFAADRAFLSPVP